ncbi:MAG: iron ABC transporter permease [Rhodobiaceae bacterium]|nr:iron ABC transporter permease [Rhodobiaceae bacterium]MCC0017130.1 iron ABC transporter permease [Rhodobiaceae bacterium]MCC0041936.1 iron ABC transporter permease [Rhodobiaceae bacterium]
MISLALAATAIATFAASLLVGPADIGVGGVLAALAGTGDTATGMIVRDLRLPRAVLTLICGGGLGMAGAALQGLLRNPLASPDLLGTGNAAAFGAVAVLSLGLAGTGSLLLPACAIAAALVSIVLLLWLAGRDARPLTVILAGLALSTFGGALVALALNLAANDFLALEIAFWLLGSFGDRGPVQVAIALPFIAVGMALMMSQRRLLAALTLGEETARSLGADTPLRRIALLCGVAATVGGQVAVSGVVGFIGLVVPHLVRPLVGARPDRLMLPSALAGATVLTAADIGVRLLPTINELKVGVVTALVGAPFFFLLVARERRRRDVG